MNTKESAAKDPGKNYMKLRLPLYTDFCVIVYFGVTESEVTLELSLPWPTAFDMVFQSIFAFPITQVK